MPLAPVAPSVFDLSVPATRMGYRATGLVPHAYKSEAEARTHGVPPEVCLILQDPMRASQYAFVRADGAPRGAAEAYTELQELGGSKVQIKWVQNHWQLILWKLAAYVASDPRQVHTYWTWDRVLRDLRYRYEREYHKKEYSVIKRLQEEPRHYTRPMVLCVHQILRFEDTGEDASLVLQLTDGWYKIRAELDAPLRRAVERCKIRIGHKLAIACAKHRCFGEGTPVLDAVYSSDLLLSSNATWFAAWDTRLGLQPHAFVSSLGRLVPDGGLVGRIDVVADRVYPVGYMEGELDAKGTLVYRGPQYNTDEEQERQRAWEERRQCARAYLAEVAPRLERAAAWLEARCHMEYEGAATADVTAVVVALEKADDPTECLATHTSAAAHASLPYMGSLLCAVRERLTAVSQPGTPPYEAALRALCAPRQVKSFCTVRVREARATRRASCRTVLLTVWEPPELEAGARYEVRMSI
ncbi:hypothetical protein MCAP1_001837 [Malassezia caprae]|uniref:Breast cancer type 2 susceptibility protein n=1 Tax=Malassezia caprae TaxID=1381934 RepID=A0AAF0E5Z9_9BASI|nr:hypothetical protein MCAP1_001837 [Malassezia caprae]